MHLLSTFLVVGGRVNHGFRKNILLIESGGGVMVEIHVQIFNGATL